MGKTILLSLLSLAISFPTHAQKSNVPTSEKNEGFYAGVDLGFSNKLENIYLETGFGIFAGYEFDLSNNFKASIETDLYGWGEWKEFSNDLSVIEDKDITASFTGYSLSVKPKYHLTDTVSLGVSFGFNSVSLIIDSKGDSAKDLQSSSVFIWGVEAGYQFDNDWSIRAGYKTSSVDFGEAHPVDLNSFYTGLGYKF